MFELKIARNKLMRNKSL